MDRAKFYSVVRHGLFDGALSASQVQGMENLLNVWDKYFWDGHVDELSYNLATSFHETAGTMQPITERGPRNYFDKYEPGTRLGKILGNTQPGDGYRYRGEGHVQNTGRSNAVKATKRINQVFKLGVDLEKHPEKRGDPFISAISLFLGNREGWWTGKRLSDYIDGVDENDAEDLREFVKSRYVVNGTDKSEKIGRHALVFENALKVAGFKKGGASAPAPTPPKVNNQPKQSFWDWLLGLFSRRKK